MDREKDYIVITCGVCNTQNRVPLREITARIILSRCVLALGNCRDCGASMEQILPKTFNFSGEQEWDYLSL
jgi:RNase P subunit RPR2